MKFVLMMHAPYGEDGGYRIYEWPKEAIEAHMAHMQRINRDLTDKGEMVGVEGLTPPVEARIVRAPTDGAPVVTDGPFPETKEFLAGFWLVDVASSERAYQIAADASAAPGPDGEPLNMAVEVRRVLGGPSKD